MSSVLLEIDNIHCSSCEGDISNVVHRIDPQAVVEILPGRSAVKIETRTPFDARQCVSELHSRGFDVRDVSSTPPSSPPSAQRHSSLESVLKSPFNALKTRILGYRSVQLDDQRAQTHSEICRACSGDDSSTAEPMDTFRVVCAVSGMTCASCADSIKEAIHRALPNVLDVSVDVVNGVVYTLCVSHTDSKTVLQAIDDAGFDATLTEVLPTHTQNTSQFHLRLAIGGMTCASCSQAVKAALMELPDVVSADVDALNGTADMVTRKAGSLDKIVQAVEDIGYTCTPDSSGFQADHAAPAGQARTVTIAVANIFCDRCPERVMDALSQFGEAVHVVDSVKMKTPFVKFTYLPAPPKFTIRAILKLLQEANPQLGFEIVKPPSLEEIAAKNQNAEKRGILRRLILTAVFAIPASLFMFGSDMHMGLMFALATPVYFFADDIFHRKAIKELKSLITNTRTPILRRLFHFGSMNMLMSLGTSISYWASVLTAVFSPETTESYFDSVIFLTFFLLVGRYLDIYSKIKTSSAVALVAQIRPDSVDLVDVQTSDQSGNSSENEDENVVPSPASRTVNLPTELIEVGDTVAVLPGMRAGCDGIVISGTSAMNEAMLTGEALPVQKSQGDAVYSGTVNDGNQSLVYKVTATSDGTLLNDIVNAVRQGQSKRAPIERYVEKITGVFVPFVIYLALLVWLVWYLVSRDVLWSMQFAIATFVVACPCGIGLAAPTALYIGSGLAAKYGILARGGGEAFQEGSRLDVIAFDKTGTLTVGTGLHITDTWGAENDAAVQLAARLEADSVHPLAIAVVESAKGRKLTEDRCSNIETISERGRGISADITNGEYAGKVAILGNENAIKNVANVPISREQELLLQKWKFEGKSVIILALQNDKVLLMMAAADQIRPESRSVVHKLKELGISSYMISGDNVETANAVAKQVGILHERVLANVLPQEKAAKIEQLQSLNMRRTVVSMVGDGINDAPALAISDVGIALGRGADIALSSSQFVLLREDLQAIPILVQISKAVMFKVKMNFFWAGIYNFVAIPIAAGVFYPYTHTRLDPVWASLAMALSSVSVMANSLLLRRYKPADL